MVGQEVLELTWRLSRIADSAEPGVLIRILERRGALLEELAHAGEPCDGRTGCFKQVLEMDEEVTKHIVTRLDSLARELSAVRYARQAGRAYLRARYSGFWSPALWLDKQA